MLCDQLGLALARLLDDPLGLALGLGQHLLALLDDPARLLDLLGDRRPHLVEQVVELLLVHAHLIPQRDLLGAVDETAELVDQFEDVHGRSEPAARAGQELMRDVRASVSLLKPETPARDEDQASAGARSAPTALLHPWKAAVTLPLSRSMEAVA
jgi:hypothetical protein